MAASMSSFSRSVFLYKNRYIHGFLNKSRLKFSTVASEVSVDINDTVYPPIKPRFPPGNWGNLSESEAWKRFDSMEEINKIPTVLERISKLTEKELRPIKYFVTNKTPKILEYQKYLTKTHIIKGMPDIHNSLQIDSSVVQKVKPYIEDVLLFEHENLHRNKQFKNKYILYQDVYKTKMLISNLMNTIIPILFEHNPALTTAQIDENVDVKAFWDRDGLRRVLWFDDAKKEPKDYRIMYAPDSRLQCEYKANFQIRTELPLPEFLSINNELCQTEEYPDLEYSPKIYGSVKWEQRRSSVVPGFNYGDPCEFGMVSVHNTRTQFDHFFARYNEATINDLILANGMSVSFVWLLAQSYYQGFNTFVDLTYPLTTQTVLTDGQTFSFYAYQLNTIDLWKDNIANPYQNLCWYTEREKLYEEIRDGKVIGFNDNVCETLLKVLLMRPEKRDIGMKPTLPSESCDILKQTEFISTENSQSK